MASVTSRWALPAPGLDDQPDGPDLGKDLADATDAALGRGLPVADAAARIALASGLDNGDRGLLVHQDDTDAMYYWTGAALLGPLSTGGGGGGGEAGGGRWAASSSQTILNTASGPGTPVAFPNEVGDVSQVTRSVNGVGHQFELLASGLWACGTTQRITSASAAGEISVGIWADTDGGGFDFNVAHDGARREGVARTMSPNRTTYLPAGTEVIVYIFNGTGTTRTTEPNGGAWVNLDLWLVG